RTAQLAVGFADEDHREHRHGDAGGKQSGAALGLQRIAQDHAFDQRNADGDREGNSQADDLNASQQQHVGDVEYESADGRVQKIGARGGVQIDKESFSAP